MKIVITNIVALNGGDAAILLGMIKAFQRTFGENIEIIAFASHPEVCAKLYPNIKWRQTLGLSVDNTRFNHVRYLGKIARILKREKYLWISRLMGKGLTFLSYLLPKNHADDIRHYLSADMVISTGGTYLIEPYGLYTQYIDYLITHNLRKPLIFYTQSMGPFVKQTSINRMKRVLSKSKMILFRDKKSLQHIINLNLEHRPAMYVVPDAAFALGNPKLLIQRNNDNFKKHMKVAISVREWQSFQSKSPEIVMQAYRESIATAVIHLIKQNYTIYFLSTCQGLPEYDNDAEEVAKIINLIPTKHHKNITNFADYIPIPQLLSILHDMDMIISTRLHMCILSLISGTPVFPIAYEFKTEELFSQLGYTDIINMENIADINISEKIDDFISLYTNSRRKEINTTITEYIKQSKEVSDILLQLFQ